MKGDIILNEKQFNHLIELANRYIQIKKLFEKPIILNEKQFNQLIELSNRYMQIKKVFEKPQYPEYLEMDLAELFEKWKEEDKKWGL